jgi:uncharacterized membrane protein
VDNAVPVAPVAPPAVPRDSGELVNCAAVASLARRERVPWRPALVGAASLGTPAGIGMLHLLLGEVIVVIEIVVVLTVIAVALFGSQARSERAFRLLRWFGNRPEPPGPA